MIKYLLKRLYTATDYPKWIKRNEPNGIILLKQKTEFFKYRPQISIMTVICDANVDFLSECLKSVFAQTYSNWELCIACKNNDLHVNKMLQSYAQTEKRIKIKFLSIKGDIFDCSNESLSLARGEFVAFLNQNDMLAPFALHEVVKLLNKIPLVDLIYSDEDKFRSKKRENPFFKPDYSPDLLLSHNYMQHLTMYRRRLIKNYVFRKDFSGSLFYDLVLRVVENTSKIFHIPKILYHARIMPGLNDAVVTNAPNTWKSGLKALSDCLKRRKIQGKVLFGKLPGLYRVRRKILGRPKVSIIIPFKDKPELLKKCVNSIIKKTTFLNYEILLISNNSSEKNTFLLLNHFNKHKNIKVIRHNKPFNFSEINNFGVGHTHGDHIILLNNDIEVITPDWIESMLEQSQRKEVGAVGAKLHYKDDTIQHAGIIIGIGNFAGHSHKHYKSSGAGYYGRASVIQNISAVTGACLMVKRSLYINIGGLNERNLKISGNDVDFCLRLRKKGYLNIFTPFAELYHHESVSRGYEDDEFKRRRFSKEKQFIRKRHKEIFINGDPYYNPNLTLLTEDFNLKNKYEHLLYGSLSIEKIRDVIIMMAGKG